MLKILSHPQYKSPLVKIVHIHAVVESQRTVEGFFVNESQSAAYEMPEVGWLHQIFQCVAGITPGANIGKSDDLSGKEIRFKNELTIFRNKCPAFSSAP